MTHVASIDLNEPLRGDLSRVNVPEESPRHREKVLSQPDWASHPIMRRVNRTTNFVEIVAVALVLKQSELLV